MEFQSFSIFHRETIHLPAPDLLTVKSDSPCNPLFIIIKIITIVDPAIVFDKDLQLCTSFGDTYFDRILFKAAIQDSDVFPVEINHGIIPEPVYLQKPFKRAFH